MVTIRKALLYEKDVEFMRDEMGSWGSQGKEAGGFIFGDEYKNGLVHFTHISNGGPRAQHSPTSYSGDPGYISTVSEEMKTETGADLTLRGEFHSHPDAKEPNLSNGDIAQLKSRNEVMSWYLSILLTKCGMAIYNIQNGKLVKIPYQIIKSELSKDLTFDRISGAVFNDVLQGKTVLIAGLGSGGSTIAKYLGCSGIGRFILVDNEELEAVNVIRHEGGIDDIGKPKTEICKNIIESHNPFAVVECHNFDLTMDLARLEELASQSDLIVASSGSPKVNHLMNKLSLDLVKPVVYGGVYAKAKGAYVLVVMPHKSACFNCLFNKAPVAYSVDKEAASRYGLDEDELHRQQGLWVSISFPSLIICNLALGILQGKQLDHNLLLYDSSMEIKKIQMVKNEECALCNPESLICPTLHVVEPKGWSRIRSKILFIFGRRRIG